MLTEVTGAFVMKKHDKRPCHLCQPLSAFAGGRPRRAKSRTLSQAFLIEGASSHVTGLETRPPRPGARGGNRARRRVLRARAARRRLPRLRGRPDARAALLPHGHDGGALPRRGLPGRRPRARGTPALGHERRDGARPAPLPREHARHQRRLPYRLRAVCPARPAHARHCRRLGLHRGHDDGRGKPRQHAHAHRQPAEPLPLLRLRNGRRRVRGAHAPVRAALRRAARAACAGAPSPPGRRSSC